MNAISPIKAADAEQVTTYARINLTSGHYVFDVGLTYDVNFNQSDFVCVMWNAVADTYTILGITDPFELTGFYKRPNNAFLFLSYPNVLLNANNTTFRTIVPPVSALLGAYSPMLLANNGVAFGVFNSGDDLAMRPFFHNTETNTYTLAPSAATQKYGFGGGGLPDSITGMSLLADGSAAMYSVSANNVNEVLHYIKFNSGTPTDTLITSVEGQAVRCWRFPSKQQEGATVVYVNFFLPDDLSNEVPYLARINTTTLAVTNVSNAVVVNLIVESSSPNGDIICASDSTDWQYTKEYVVDLVHNMKHTTVEYIHSFDSTIPYLEQPLGDTPLYIENDMIYFNNLQDIWHPDPIFRHETYATTYALSYIPGSGWILGTKQANEHLRMHNLGYY